MSRPLLAVCRGVGLRSPDPSSPETASPKRRIGRTPLGADDPSELCDCCDPCDDPWDDPWDDVAKYAAKDATARVGAGAAAGAAAGASGGVGREERGPLGLVRHPPASALCAAACWASWACWAGNRDRFGG